MNFKTCLFLFTSFTALNSLFLDVYVTIGLSIMLLTHEYGHIHVLRRYGIRHSYPIFIPILGALIVTDQIEDEETEMEVAFGGPLFGTLGACAVGGIYILTEQRVWFDICILGMILNFVNLSVTVSPLDGGRIMNGISPSSRKIGLLLSVIACFYVKTFILFTAFTTFLYFYFKKTTPQKSKLARKTQLKWKCFWFGFVLFQLAFMVLILKIYTNTTK